MFNICAEIIFLCAAALSQHWRNFIFSGWTGMPGLNFKFYQFANNIKQ